MVKAAPGVFFLATVLGIVAAAFSSGMMKLPQALHHLLVGQMLVRYTPAKVQDLPQGNREGPHVALGRVLSLIIRAEITENLSTAAFEATTLWQCNFSVFQSEGDRLVRSVLTER